MRNSLRLGVLLTALVGINVYVFFFNRGTAPREVLNLQSTSKSVEGTRRELLAKDAQKAGRMLAAASTAPKPLAAAKTPAPPPRVASTAAPPAFKIPFAPPPEPAPLSSP